MIATIYREGAASSLSLSGRPYGQPPDQRDVEEVASPK
jgi:hypothetical protein